jgi:hypothetical protein
VEQALVERAFALVAPSSRRDSQLLDRMERRASNHWDLPALALLDFWAYSLLALRLLN